MNCLADRNLRLQDCKVYLLTRNLPSERTARSRGLQGIACAMALLLAATCARAQFGVQPVGASSGNQGITVTATVAGTVSSVEVLTLGSSSGDFAVGTGSSNCASANLSVGSKCTESVTFTPAEPGLRTGAVVLVGTVSGQTTVLGTAYLSGTGQGGLGVLVAGNVLPVAGQLGLYKAVDDEQLATKAELYAPGGAVVDGAGNLYIADTGHHRIRMVCGASATPTIAGTSCAAGAGIISTIAGNGDPTYSGDDGPAVSATVNTPGDVALDGAGNLYIADSGNNVIRMINAATGVITTVAGNFNGTVCGGATDTVGDGCAATQATLNLPQGVTIDGSGNLYIADTNNHRIREVSATTGSISTIAGSGFTNTNGSGGYNGDNITAITARLNFPYAVAFDAAGNMYIPDSANHRIREVLAVSGVITASSNITTFAGTGQPAATPCTATPVAATQALVWYPSGVAVDAAGNVYIAETQNAAIRKVSADTGDISTIVQNDCGNYYVNGQFMTQVLYGPTGLYLDGKGDLYIADTLDMLIREVQGNFVAINLTAPPVFQGQTSPTQLQTVENDGNAPLDLASITVEAPPNPPEAELETAVTNSCANGQTLTENADCVVGAVFAPPASPVLTVNTQETPIIDVADESMTGTALSTSPLQIELVGTAEPLYATNTLVTSSPNPSGLGQSVTFTVTVTTGSGALTGTVSISDTFNGVTTTLATALPLTASGSTSATATFSISTLLVGLHSITATYTPGTTDIHTGSTSPAETQSVVEGTSVNLTSSANPSTVGQSVTFTATVSNSAGGVNPTGTINFYDGFNLLGSQAINASYMATFTTSALTNGMHSITAQFVPSADTQLQSSTSPVLSQDVQAAAKIAIISSLNPSTYGTPVTFTATITSAAAFPATGTVTFLDNGVSIGTGTLGGSPATATLLISSLPVGTDPITVTYAGDAYNSSGSSAALNQVVDQGQTVTTVTLATPNPGIAGTAETISATVVLTSGSAPLAGTVTFTSGTQTLGSATLTSGAASITPTLALGSYQVVATYQPSNPNAGASTSSPFPYTVVLATTQTTLVVAPNPDLVLTPITFTALVAGNGGTPTGSVNFLVNGTVVGTTALNGGKATYTDSTLLVGTYSITAQYLGDTNDSTSVSAATSETVTTIPTTTVITSGITTGANPQVILVAAVLDNGTGPVPTGTVTFYNGNTVLGSATVDSTGAATITPSLALGANYSVDAVYSGDSEHGSSTSSALSVSGTPVDFGVIVTPSTVTMASSQNATVTVTLISNANFTGTIGLGCSTLPAAVNCHFASISLNLPAGGSVSTQLTIDTNNPLSGGSSAMNRRPGDGRFSLAGLFLPLSLGFGFVFWRWRRRHAQVFTMALVLVLTAAAFVATGCGGFSQVTAAPGTYVIQVTGTNTASDVVHYQNVTLDITN